MISCLRASGSWHDHPAPAPLRGMRLGQRVLGLLDLERGADVAGAVAGLLARRSSGLFTPERIAFWLFAGAIRAERLGESPEQAGANRAAARSVPAVAIHARSRSAGRAGTCAASSRLGWVAVDPELGQRTGVGPLVGRTGAARRRRIEGMGQMDGTWLALFRVWRWTGRYLDPPRDMVVHGPWLAQAADRRRSTTESATISSHQALCGR